MIKLDVEEAYLIDILSVLEIKYDKFPENPVVVNNYYKHYDSLEQQFGQRKFRDIISSFEYEDLKNINLLNFDAVDKARANGNITAKAVDLLNIERHRAKQAVQKKFFLTELKEYKNI
jgi:hypothetical protein